MPDLTLTSSLRGLILSAAELQQITEWPDALIEDYLSLFENLVLLAEGLQDALTYNDVKGTAGQIVVTINADKTVTISAPTIIENFTATGTIAALSDVIYANGTFDLFLPPLAAGFERTYEIKNVGTGIVTLKPNAIESTVKIEGERMQPLCEGDSFTLISDNVDWWVI